MLEEAIRNEKWMMKKEKESQGEGDMVEILELLPIPAGLLVHLLLLCIWE